MDLILEEDLDIEEVLKDAITQEEAAYQRYVSGAEIAPDADTRTLFNQLAQWEQEHARLLRDRLTAIRLLKSSGGP